MKKLVITAILSGMILISLIIVYFVTTYEPKQEISSTTSKLQEFQLQQMETSETTPFE